MFAANQSRITSRIIANHEQLLLEKIRDKNSD